MLRIVKVVNNMSRIVLLNTNIDVLTIEETVKQIESYIVNQMPLHIMGVNADKINLLNIDDRLKKIVNSCGIINADGASVVLASKFLGKPLPERVAGIDLMIDLIKLAENKGYSIYLLGAKEEVVQKTADVLKQKYPKLNIAGIRNGYFSDTEWSNIAEAIRGSHAQIAFIGITSPLKEYLVEYLQDQGLKCVFMGVGGSFDVISGTIPRAPLWMQNYNIEWLFRVLQEPRRLFKRYFIGNWKFIISVCKEKKNSINL